MSISPSRDPRLDFFRGLALLCIFVDHIPGDRLADYTVRNLGFSDASEIFVFISAYTAGLVYMPRVGRDGFWAVSRRIWRRVMQIYGAHLLLLGTVCLLAAWLTKTLGDEQFINGLNIRPLLEHPRETFLPALMLTFQPTFMNILPLYVVLMASLPLMLWMIRRSQVLALLLSLLVYVFARQFPTVMDNPLGTTWQFNPLAWQLLFIVGASLGASAHSGALRVPRSRTLFAVAAVFAVWSFSVLSKSWVYDDAALEIPQALHAMFFPIMDRANLSLWRLSHLLALAYVVTWFLPADSRFFHLRVSRLLILCGQHSLTLFCVGVLLSIAGWAVLFKFGGTLLAQVLVNAGGFAVMVAVAWLLAVLSRPRSRAPIPVAGAMVGSSR